MKIKLKSEKGAITLVVLVGMLFLTTFLMSVYITTGNKARTSAETTNKIAEQYNNLNEDIENVPLMFEVEIANTQIEMKEDGALLNIKVKNYDENLIYNDYPINYQISLENNTGFVLSTGNDENIIYRTIKGNKIIEENIELQLSAKDVFSEEIQEVDLKIKAFSPYEKEISIPLEIDVGKELDYIYDLSGNGYELINVGAIWDKENKTITTDGIDDYLYIENLDWEETTEFTIDFVAKIAKQENVTTPIILFETSIDSNLNYGAFYVDTNEFGTNEITLAMKYTTDKQRRSNHKYVNNIIDNNEFRHYTITFNSLKEYDNFTRIYLDGLYQNTTTHPNKEGQNGFDYTANISGEKIVNYPFYIGSRAGKKFFSEMTLKEVRVYNKALSDEEVMKNHKGNIVTDKLLLYYDFGKVVGY